MGIIEANVVQLQLTVKRMWQGLGVTCKEGDDDFFNLSVLC